MPQRTFARIGILVMACILVLSGLRPAMGNEDAPTGMRRLAIVTFDPPAGGHQRVAVAFTDMLAAELTRRGVPLLEREQLEAVLRERRLVESGMVQADDTVAAAKLLGATALLGGRITEMGVRDDSRGVGLALGPIAGVRFTSSTAVVRLDCRLLDTATGQVIAAPSAKGQDTRTGVTAIAGQLWQWLSAVDFSSKEWADSQLGRAARRAAEDIAKQIAQLFPRQAQVLAVLDSDRAVIDMGAVHGVKRGDRFQLCRVSDVKNSAGRVVWQDVTPYAEARVTELQEGRALVRVERWLSDPRTMQENDVARAK